MKEWYHRLFVSIWCLAEKYQGAKVSVLYACTILAIIWMFGVMTVVYGADAVRGLIWGRFIAFSEYWGLPVVVLAKLLNAVYFFWAGRWRELVEAYAEVGGDGWHKPRFAKWKAIAVFLAAAVIALVVATVGRVAEHGGV